MCPLDTTHETNLCHLDTTHHSAAAAAAAVGTANNTDHTMVEHIQRIYILPILSYKSCIDALWDLGIATLGTSGYGSSGISLPSESINSLSVVVSKSLQHKEFDLLKWDQQVVSDLVEKLRIRRTCFYTQDIFFKDVDQDSAHMVAASKVPMLKPREYEIWRMRIKQYIQMIDYALWEVI
ncbi:hypothetical protein Tco_0421775 [Tanacetum coccineum]